MKKNQLQFENNNEFDMILIIPHDIKDLDWNNSDYTSNIIKLDCYEILKTNSDTFLEIIASKLNLDKFKNKSKIEIEIKTQIICEIPNYIYELLYIGNLTENDDKINNVAN